MYNPSYGDFSIFKKKIIDVRARISRNRQTIRSVAALFSSNMASTVLTVVGGLLVARFLGPEETGLFRAFTIPLTYLMFLHLGTLDGLWRQIPYYVGKEMPEKVDALASAAGAFNLFMSVVVSCGFICCATYSLLHHDLYGVFGWLSQALFCWGVFYGGYLTSTYRTLHHFVTLARIQVAQINIDLWNGLFVAVSWILWPLCACSFPVGLGGLALPPKPAAQGNLSLRYKGLQGAYQDRSSVQFLGKPLYIRLDCNRKRLGALPWRCNCPWAFFGRRRYAGGDELLARVDRQVLTPRVVTALARDGSVRNANARIIWVTVGLTGFMIVLACLVSFLLDIFVPYFIPKYVDGIPVMKVCLWFPVVQAAFLPMNTLFATGRPWLYGRSVIAGLVVFPLATYLLFPVIGGLLAVAVGSLLGRAARTGAAYIDLFSLSRREV